MQTDKHKVLVLFSGPYERPDDIKHYLNQCGIEAVMVDNDGENGGDAADDLSNDQFYHDLLERAHDGEFLAVVAAPPCSTFSVARLFPLEA